MDLSKIEKIVEIALKEKLDSRDDDKLLMLYVWQWQGLKLNKDQISYFRRHCINPESITRMRRLFQERGMYRPEDPQKRLFVEQEVKEFIKKHE